MARRASNRATRRTATGRARRRTRKKPFVLRWFHLLIACISAFFLGYLIAFGQATSYVSAVVGLR